MANPLHGAAATRIQREQPIPMDADSKKRKAAAYHPQAAQQATDERDASREKRALLEQMVAGASPSAVTGRPAQVVSDAAITDAESVPEAQEAAPASQTLIVRSPQELAREIDVRIRLAEDAAVSKVLSGEDLLVFITLHHANPHEEKVIGMWQQAELKEKALPLEITGYFQYLLAKAVGKFQEFRRDHPTSSLAYQNAPDTVIIAACKLELIKMINELFSHVNRLSKRYIQQKALTSQQATSRFEVMLKSTLSKFPNTLLPQVRETLEKGDDGAKAQLRGLYALSRPDIDTALDKLYTFFSEEQNAFLRPLFIYKYVQEIHIRLNAH